MRLDDIHGYIEAKRVHDRAYCRAFGKNAESTVYMGSASELREAATLTDRSIHRVSLENGNASLYFDYQGVQFRWWGAEEGAVA